MIDRQRVYGVVRELGVAGALTWLLFACSGKVLLGDPAGTGGGFGMAGSGGLAGSGRSGAAGAIASGGFASGAGGTGAFGGAVITAGSTSYAGNGPNGGYEVLLPVDMLGFMLDAARGTGGPWYSYGDGLGPDGSPLSGDCERAGHPVSQCAEIMTPAAGSFPNVAGAMRTVGVVEQIGNVPGSMGCPMISQSCDYSSQWGAGIGVDLNNATGTKLPFNASANGVIGIAFDIDTVPLSGLRVELPTPTTTDTPHVYLPGGAASNYLSPLVPGHNRVLFTDLAQPDYVSALTAFDPTALLSVQFHVPTTTAAAGSYEFTISNFAFIVSGS